MIRRSGIFQGKTTNGHNRNGRFGRGGIRGGRSGHDFAQHGRGVSDREMPPDDVELVPGVDGTSIPMRCYHCNAWGYGLRNCPVKNN